MARFGRGFSDRINLFLFSFFQSLPNKIRRPGSVFDKKIAFLVEILLSTTAIRIGGLVYKIHNLEGLTILNPIFEAFMTIWFQPKKGDIFVDIGAHIGKYTISAAKAVGDEGLVIAVEPHPETFKILKKNAELNHFKNLLLFNTGAWNSSGKLKFHFGGSASEFSAHETGYRKFVIVQTKRMDELLVEDLKLKRVDWIKIDVEKAEFEVLEGLEQTIQRYKPRIFMEVWGNNKERVQAFLKAHGYSMILVSNSFGSASNWCIYLVCIPTNY